MLNLIFYRWTENLREMKLYSLISVHVILEKDLFDITVIWYWDYTIYIWGFLKFKNILGFFRVLYVNDSIFILFESKYEGSRKELNEQICWLMAVGAENKTHHQKLCDLKSFLLYFQEMHDLFVGFSVKPRTSLRPFPRICRCYVAT